MLSSLIQRQKIWVIPLMVSLALSWCLLFCAQLFAQTQPEVSQQSELPPCHTMLAGHDMTELMPSHELCSGCALDAVQTVTPELPVVVLWLQAVIEPELSELAAEQHSLYLAQGPPYPRTTPLYLQKSLLLI